MKLLKMVSSGGVPMIFNLLVLLKGIAINDFNADEAFDPVWFW